jgi:tryptophanyl-tRNA synthetase
MFESNVAIIKTECIAGSRGCVICKHQLSQQISKKLEPIRERRDVYAQNLQGVKELVFEGTKKARVLATETLAAVKEKMHLNYEQ